MKLRLLLPTLLLVAACTPMPSNTNPDAMTTSSSDAIATDQITVDWKVWPAETDDQGQPHSSLFLVVGEEDVKIGDYAGVFGDLRANGGLKSDEIMHGQYWWAGAGTEVMVKRTATGLDVLTRSIEEEVDVGEFKVVKSIPVMVGTQVNVAPARAEY